MALANDINDLLDTPLSVFWPTYENTGKPVKSGDRAIGTTFDHNGRDYQHEGTVVNVILIFSDVFQDCLVTIEDDRGNDWGCDADVIELVRDRDAKGGERPMRTLDDESPVTVPYGLAHMMVSGTIRYYMGRNTIAAHAVAEGVAKLLPQLAESTRGVLERDLRRWLDENPTCEFGCVDDREPWARLLEAIEEDA